MARTATKPVVPKYAAAGAKRVWLTFDDGPHRTNTPRVLDTLAAHGIKATFFLIGKNCAFYPVVLRRIADEGHRIANHSYSHANLTLLTRQKIKDELRKTEALIGPYVKGKKLFRPPYGAHNALVDEVVAELGYRLVLWNVDTLDWSAKFKPRKWVQHGINQIKARQTSVVLNHDIHRTTAANLGSFIRKIKAIRGVVLQKAADL
jgi:peptidoglycan/xylan/chitin deacetylase (PgdA/CDA1 family)